MIRTKIVATMGPACSEEPVLLQMLEAGVDVCRINFSHGTLAEKVPLLKNIRGAAEKHGESVAILGDLGGPKIRLGQIADEGGTGGMPVKVGDVLVIQREPIVGSNRRASSTYPQLVDDVKVGDRVLIEDGLLRFVCTEKTADEILCNCTAGGVLKSSKGINLPNTSVNVPSITDRDWECIDWAIDNRLDYLALSFVRRADELMSLRQYLRDKISDIHLIAKIEKAEALQHIDPILDASDGLMVARGDLGVEMDVAQVPIIQKDLIRRCQAAGKPVIVATQMLQSMIEQSSPTRAEVSDVANAIFDGTDAVMLSGETSVGKYPLGAVLTMAHVAKVTETYLSQRDEEREDFTEPKVKTRLAAGALARGAYRIAQDMKAKLVVIWTQTGETARVFSKHRFPMPIIALSNDQRVLRRMALHYGVLPQESAPASDMAPLIQSVDKIITERKLGDSGDPVLVVAGWSPAMPGTMNGMVIHTIGQPWMPMPSSQALRQMVRNEKETR